MRTPSLNTFLQSKDSQPTDSFLRKYGKALFMITLIAVTIAGVLLKIFSKKPDSAVEQSAGTDPRVILPHFVGIGNVPGLAWAFLGICVFAIVCFAYTKKGFTKNWRRGLRTCIAIVLMCTIYFGFFEKGSAVASTGDPIDTAQTEQVGDKQDSEQEADVESNSEEQVADSTVTTRQAPVAIVNTDSLMQQTIQKKLADNKVKAEKRRTDSLAKLAEIKDCGTAKALAKLQDESDWYDNTPLVVNNTNCDQVVAEILKKTSAANTPPKSSPGNKNDKKKDASKTKMVAVNGSQGTSDQNLNGTNPQPVTNK